MNICTVYCGQCSIYYQLQILRLIFWTEGASSYHNSTFNICPKTRKCPLLFTLNEEKETKVLYRESVLASNQEKKERNAELSCIKETKKKLVPVVFPNVQEVVLRWLHITPRIHIHVISSSNVLVLI